MLVTSPLGQVLGPVALLAAGEEVAQPDVAEGAAHHHLVVAAPRAEAVEVARLHAVLLQVAPGGRAGRDAAGRRDVVGGDRVAQHRERPRADDVGDRSGLGADALEEGRPLDVGGLGVPVVGLALGDGQRGPAVVAVEDRRVARLEQLAADRPADGLGHLGRRRPDLGEVDRVAVAVLAQRLGGEVDVDPPGQGVGDHQRRRGEVARPDLGVDAPLEVAVAREHRRRDQAVLLDGVGDRLGQRARVADAGGAAVAHQVEAQPVEVLREAGAVEVAGHRAAAGGEAGLHPRRRA